MSKVDDILGLIDKGLQESSEDHVYRDVAPTMKDGCVRSGCRNDVAEPVGGIQSEFCDPCRTYLLGDGEGPDPVRALDDDGWCPCTSCMMNRLIVNRLQNVGRANVIDLRSVVSDDAVDAAIHAVRTLVTVAPEDRTSEDMEGVRSALDRLVEGVITRGAEQFDIGTIG